MIPILQKHNHCFVACVASMVCDRDASLSGVDTTQLQEAIVARFPEALQKVVGDKEGVPATHEALREVLVGLGLAKKVQHVTGDSGQLLNILRDGKCNPSKIILCSKVGYRHCWRIESIAGDQLAVMDPSGGKIRTMSDNEFRELGITLLIVDSEHFPDIPPLCFLNS